MTIEFKKHYYVAFDRETGRVAQAGEVDMHLLDAQKLSMPGLELLVVDRFYRSPNEIVVKDGRVVAAPPRPATEKIEPFVESAIRGELTASDKTQIPDYPISDADRAAWKVYRHALRRLSDLKDPMKMIRAWPDRPDGADPIAHLRARIPGEK
jgi:hypothetical protein